VEQLSSLVLRAQAGAPDAYGEIVQLFQDMAYGYAYSLLGEFHWAEDAAQEAFIEAYREMDQLREPEAFPGWFRKIVFKHCDRLIRDRRSWAASLDDADQVASRESDPSEAMERGELRDQVRTAIKALPDSERTVTMLFYINGYSQREVADFLEVPVTTVKNRLYTSRKRLAERMISMVTDNLRQNALPRDFARETVDKAVAQAQKLNREHKYQEAEQLLRNALVNVPEHAGALKELNRALMRGRVYGEYHWDVMPEIAAHGRAILESGEPDEYVYHEVARTLLSIPAMREAVEFISGWISKLGPNLERLGMFAWAKGCVADYAGAEATWERVLECARSAPPDEVAAILPSAAEAMVDCFAAANEAPRAAHVVRTAWEQYRRVRGAVTEYSTTYPPIVLWPYLFKQAGLGDEAAIAAREWLALCQARTAQDWCVRGEALCARAWFDNVDAIFVDWLPWLGERLAAHEERRLQEMPLVQAFERAGRLDEHRRLAQATWEWLGTMTGIDVAAARSNWGYKRYVGVAAAYLWAGNPDKAEEIAREAVASGHTPSRWVLAEVAIARGAPTPLDIVSEIREKGVESYDSYGLQGWYIVAREAAAEGKAEEAFAALRRACKLWSNPPLWPVRAWEKDTRWGALREHPEFKRILDERRQRVGPVYGSLWYHPGW
jgi:RNA polymerase sigma factor (sigma-70 family)